MFTYTLAVKERSELTTKVSKRKFFDKIYLQVAPDSTRWYVTQSSIINPLALKLVLDLQQEYGSSIPFPSGARSKLKDVTREFIRRTVKAKDYALLRDVLDGLKPTPDDILGYMTQNAASPSSMPVSFQAALILTAIKDL